MASSQEFIPTKLKWLTAAGLSGLAVIATTIYLASPKMDDVSYLGNVQPSPPPQSSQSTLAATASATPSPPPQASSPSALPKASNGPIQTSPDPSPYPTPIPTLVANNALKNADQAACQYSHNADKKIVGLTISKTKLYFVPGHQHYLYYVGLVDTGQSPEITRTATWFCTESDAQSAGYTPAPAPKLR